MRKLTVLLDDDLHRALKVRAAEERKTAAEVVRSLLTGWLSSSDGVRAPGALTRRASPAEANTGILSPGDRIPAARESKPTLVRPQDCPKYARHRLCTASAPCPVCGYVD